MTAADRDFQRHVGHAEAAVRQAIDVCGRASRSLQGDEQNVYRNKALSLQAAEKLLASIGHMDAEATDVDIRREARALLSWLEGRRHAVTGLPGRRGQAYQDALRQVEEYLQPMKRPEIEDDTPEPPPVDEQELFGVTNG